MKKLLLSLCLIPTLALPSGYFAGGGASSIAIGASITSGLDGSILFVHPAGVLAQDSANLSYSSLNGQLSLGVAPIITPFGTAGVVHNSSAGLLSSSLLVNADVSATAAIVFSKMAALSNSIVPVTNGSGVITSSSVTATTLGFLDATSSIQTQLNGKQASGNYITDLTGDGTASGPGSVALTLATVNANTGSFGSSTAIPAFTVNGKGLITAASTNAVVAPASTVTGTTLASNVVTSSLTTVGTVGAGAWQGTAVGSQWGGTGSNFSSSTGIPTLSSGAWTINTSIPSSVLKAPTVTVLNSTGTTTGYLFTISTTTTCAVGDTYTNNGHTYTVLGALSAQTGAVLFMSGASAPTAPGTALVRSTGAGTASISFTASAALATYTTPSPAPLYLKIRLIGGGGGGGGQGSGANPGGAGSYSTFGPNLLLGNGGSGGGAASNYGGAGGSASVTAPAVGIAVAGAYGASAGNHASLAANLPGGSGGSSPFGGAGGGGGPAGNAALNAASNSGSGGAGPESASSANTGSGGGAGGYCDVLLPSPGASYPYIIGTGGSAGNSGTGTGGTGAAGVIFIEEIYQ